MGFVPTYTASFSLTKLPFLNAGNSHPFFGTESSPTRLLEFRVVCLSSRLSIRRAATDTTVVSWSRAGAEGWGLQVANALPNAAAAWPAMPPPYLTHGANLEFIESAPVGKKFYRLHKP